MKPVASHVRDPRVLARLSTRMSSEAAWRHVVPVEQLDERGDCQTNWTPGETGGLGRQLATMASMTRPAK